MLRNQQKEYLHQLALVHLLGIQHDSTFSLKLPSQIALERPMWLICCGLKPAWALNQNQLGER